MAGIKQNLNIANITGGDTGGGSGGSAAAKLAILEKALAGDGYSYIAATEAPKDLGVSTEAGAIKTNINSIFDYTQLLINGDGPANAIQHNYGYDIPIGDRYFVNTGGQCQPVTASKGCQNTSGGCSKESVGHQVKTAEGKVYVVPRSVLIDNIPHFNIPIPEALKKAGKSGEKFDGIIPGIVNDVLTMNPMGLLGAFVLPAYPECVNVEVNTVTGKGEKAYDVVKESAYVITAEAQNINPCAFSNGQNPLTGESCPGGPLRVSAGFESFSELYTKCMTKAQPLIQNGMLTTEQAKAKCQEEAKQEMDRESFTTLSGEYLSRQPEKLVYPKDNLIKLYMFLISVLGMFVIYRLMYRRN